MRRERKAAVAMAKRVVQADRIRQREEGKSGFKAMPYAGFGSAAVAHPTQTREDESDGI